MRRALFLLGLGVLPLGPARAGPLEARALWDAAKATATAPWPVRVRALRAAAAAAHPTDSVHRRSLVAIGSTLRRAGHQPGALAFQSRAATLGARRDRRRIDAELTLGKMLRREMDLEAAARHLDAVARDGRAVAWRSAEKALHLLAEDAFDRGDGGALRSLLERQAKARCRAHVRLETLGWLGLLQLERGDRRSAERTHRAAKRLYTEAARADDAAAIRCARLWLDYPLREALSRARADPPPRPP